LKSEAASAFGVPISLRRIDPNPTQADLSLSRAVMMLAGAQGARRGRLS
jgi:hypothetical protein